MATCDYECNECGNIFEGQTTKKEECPKCNSTNNKRIWTPTTSIWKCSGACGKSK